MASVAKRAKRGDGNGKEVAAVTEIVTTRDGKEVRGVRIADDGFTLLIRDNSGEVRRFDTSNLLERHEDTKQPMPEDYGKILTQSELQDLTAYLKAQKFRDLAKTAQVDIPVDYSRNDSTSRMPNLRTG
jgi:hypothetical protein